MKIGLKGIFKPLAVLGAVVLCLSLALAVVPVPVAAELTFNNPGYTFQQLTDEPAPGARHPSFSPDGTRIVYATGLPGGSGQIWVMESDGTGKQRLDNGTGYECTPFWSSDGQCIIWSGGTVDDAFVMAVDVTITGENYTYSDPYVFFHKTPAEYAAAGIPDVWVGGANNACNPAWFPGHDKIVFWVFFTDNQADLFAYEKSTDTLTRITDTPDYSDYEPKVSPDGTKIIYWSGETPTELGPNVREIPTTGWPITTPGTLIAEQASWPNYNRDGTLIGYSHHYGTGYTLNRDIYIADATGEFKFSLTNLGDGQGDMGYVEEWGPDGEIVFASMRGGSAYNIWLATPNTTDYAYIDGVGYFSTIQEAINAASPGDTINVTAGTYDEQVVINKSLTLEGAGAESTTIVAPGSPESFKFTESGSFWEPVVFAFGGAGDIIAGTGTITVTISGFTIDGNDRVPTDRSAGILLRNAGGTISGNTVKNMFIDGKETFGIAAYGDSDVVIAENNVSGYARGGIVASGDNSTNPDPNAIITGNTVTGPGMDVSVTYAPNGIQIGYGATGEVTGNTVSGNGWPGTDWTGSGILVAMSDGVEVDDNTVTGNETGIGVCGYMWAPDGITANGTRIHDNMVDGNTYGISIQNKSVNTTIENNTIKNSSYDGIDICNFDYSGYYGPPPTGTTIQGNTITANNTENDETSGGIWVAGGVNGDEVSVNFNNIVGNNGFGVLNTSTTNTIDATNNWWGTAVESEIAAMVSGNVDYDPWIGAPTDPEETVVETVPTGGGEVIPEGDSPTGGAITVTGSGIPAGTTLVAATYEGNPGGAHGLQAQGYYDVHLSNTTGVTSVTIQFAGLPNTVIYYWDGTAWTACSDQEYAGGVVTVTISSSGTTPGLGYLTGGPFMPATSPPIGGEAFPISPWAANAPLIALGVALAAGAGVFVWRRARA